MQQKQTVRNQNLRLEYREAMPYVVRNLSWELPDEQGRRQGWPAEDETKQS